MDSKVDKQSAIVHKVTTLNIMSQGKGNLIKKQDKHSKMSSPTLTTSLYLCVIILKRQLPWTHNYDQGELYHFRLRLASHCVENCR